MGKRTVREIPVKLQPGGAVEELPRPCPVCGLTPHAPAWWSCEGCGVTLHSECLWGRVATLEEWRAFQQSPEVTDESGPPVLCPSCRRTA